MAESEEHWLELYSRELRSYDPLTTRETAELFSGIRDSEATADDARRRLGEVHLAKVVDLAVTVKQDRQTHVMDLILEGNLALLRAAMTFEARSVEDVSEFWAHTEPLILQAMRDFPDDPPSDGRSGDRGPRNPIPPTGSAAGSVNRPRSS